MLVVLGAKSSLQCGQVEGNKGGDTLDEVKMCKCSESQRCAVGITTSKMQTVYRMRWGWWLRVSVQEAAPH